MPCLSKLADRSSRRLDRSDWRWGRRRAMPRVKAKPAAPGFRTLTHRNKMVALVARTKTSDIYQAKDRFASSCRAGNGWPGSARLFASLNTSTIYSPLCRHLATARTRRTCPRALLVSMASSHNNHAIDASPASRVRMRLPCSIVNVWSPDVTSMEEPGSRRVT